MNKKLKIAIFHLAFVYSGGGERLVLEEAIGLQKLGHDVTVFAPVINEKKCFPELISKVKIKKLIPSLPLFLPDAEYISIILACLLAPLFFFKFRNYDLYFGANQPGPWISFVLSKINRKPYAIYLAQPTRLVHPRVIDQQVGLRIDDGFTLLNISRVIFNPLFNLLDIKSIKNAKVVFANGSYAKGILEEIYKIKTINTPAAANVNELKPLEISKRFRGSLKIGSKTIKKPYILLTNRHFPQKKFEYAIDALQMLKINNLSLVITGGETNYTKYLKKHSKSKKNIQFLGLVSEIQLDKLYRNAYAYVYPSPEEDFGMGIVEAMSYGVPVVAWENAGPTGIIKDGVDGLLARPFSVYDFSKQIEKLLTNKTLYKSISKNAHNKFLKYFTYELHNKTLEENLRKLVSK